MSLEFIKQDIEASLKEVQVYDLSILNYKQLIGVQRYINEIKDILKGGI